MSARLASLLVVAVVLSFAINAPILAKNKDKKKSVLPEYVLRAETVRVIIAPDAGEPLDQPMANSRARDNVEKAFSEWGRYRVVMDGQQADLLISVRTGSGNRARPTVKGGPIDQRGGVAQGTDSSIRIGGGVGRQPGDDPTMNPPNQGPHMSHEIGPSEDMFEVYRGGVSGPLDSPPVWRYIAKDCLLAPNLRAVDEFRKAVADSEKPKVPLQKQP